MDSINHGSCSCRLKVEWITTLSGVGGRPLVMVQAKQFGQVGMVKRKPPVISWRVTWKRPQIDSTSQLSPARQSTSPNDSQ